MKKLLWWATLALSAAGAQEVPYERIRRAAEDASNWLTYSGSYAALRHSPLTQITPANAARLRPAWLYQITARERFETSPLVIDGVMYLTEPGCKVTALDAKTGGFLWTYERPLPRDVSMCCGSVNRGLAALGDSLFLQTLDARLIALDMKSGAVKWNVEIADYRRRYSGTGAPLAVKDKIIAGIAGGEFGAPGFLDAYDAKTGKRLWRFWTIPRPGEPGSETWAGDSAKTGGVPTWLTGAYDPAMNLVLWGLGNPSPAWNAGTRAGDNLYADCLVALDADSGNLKWYFQFTPGDDHDWDATQTPVLVDRPFRGEPRKLVLFANRNGFFYALDRETGKFLVGKPFVKQNWAAGLDENGRPIRLPNMSPSIEGTLTYPSSVGGTNWFSPSYSPQTGLFYVPACDGGDYFHQSEPVFSGQGLFMAGGIRPIPGEPLTGAVRALIPDTGDVKWEFKMAARPHGGVLSTAGGVVFGSSLDGYFFALDAATGKPLWRLQTGGEVSANPITYAVDGKQHVAIAAGHALFAFTVD